MATEEDVAAGLIDWINSLHVADSVYIVEELNDGQILWKALQQIDNLSFPGNLPEENTQQWIHKWTNLKHIHDALSIFLIEECSQRLPLPSGRPDLKAIAQSSSLVDAVRLLKLLVVAAINCANRIEFLKQMQELAEGTQEVLMSTAQEAEEDDREDVKEDSSFGRELGHISESTSAPVDSDLASEERLGKVLADNHRIALEKRDLQKQLEESYARFEKLQELHDRSQDELKVSNDRLTAILAGKSEDGSSRPLDPKQESIIASIEARAAAAESQNEGLRKSNEVLKIKAEKVQTLQDDFDEMKIERDRLSRKANTAEKYKQKLEASQDLEKENQNLRSKVNELQNQLKQSDSSRVSTSDLQREIDEYRRLLPSIEQERYELNEMKKRLEFDYHSLEARYHETSEQLSRQDHTIEELQGRLRDFEDGIPPSTPASDQTKNLETEEVDFNESEARLTAALFNGDMENESGITEDELKAIMSAMRAQAHAGSASERESSIKSQKKLLIAVERGQTKVKQLLNHVQKQSELITNLRDHKNQHQTESVSQNNQSTLRAEEKSDEYPNTISSVSKSNLEDALQLNENLRRELNLMTSAWYEQNRRIASGGTTSFNLRSGPEPRSFLGKQRKAADTIILRDHGR